VSNKKISALTSATTPLAGTEVLPIVQSGATVKVASDDLTVRNIRANATTGILQVTGPGAGTTRVATVPNANWTAARTDAAQSFTGDQTLSTGNLVQGTAAKGFNFTANTPAAGMTSQLLNWYEQGTFTPAAAGTTTAGVGTYSTQVGRYTRVGNLVTVKVALAWSAHTGTGNLIFTGLPFTVANDGADCSMALGYLSNLALTALNVLTLIARVNTTTVGAYQYPVGGGAVSLVPIDTAVTLIEFSGTYNV